MFHIGQLDFTMIIVATNGNLENEQDDFDCFMDMPILCEKTVFPCFFFICIVYLLFILYLFYCLLSI